MTSRCFVMRDTGEWHETFTAEISSRFFQVSKSFDELDRGQGDWRDTVLPRPIERARLCRKLLGPAVPGWEECGLWNYCIYGTLCEEIPLPLFHFLMRIHWHCLRSYHYNSCINLAHCVILVTGNRNGTNNLEFGNQKDNTGVKTLALYVAILGSDPSTPPQEWILGTDRIINFEHNWVCPQLSLLPKKFELTVWRDHKGGKEYILHLTHQFKSLTSYMVGLWAMPGVPPEHRTSTGWAGVGRACPLHVANLGFNIRHPYGSWACQG